MINHYSIVRELEKILKQTAENLFQADVSALIVATLSLQTRTYERGVKVYIKDRKLHTLELLACVSWYLPADVRSLLQLQLGEIIQNNNDLRRVKLLLISKTIMLNYLNEIVATKGPEHLFGNYLDKQMLKNLKLKVQIRTYKISRLVHYPEPKRIGVGYKDKGHAPEDHKWMQQDLTLTHNAIEEERSLNNSLTALEEGFLS